MPPPVTNPELQVERERLTAAVMRDIHCKISGRVLDKRSAVLVTITGTLGAPSRYAVYDGPVWDERREGIAKIAAARRWRIEVIDGRKAFKSPSRVRQPLAK